MIPWIDFTGAGVMQVATIIATLVMWMMAVLS